VSDEDAIRALIGRYVAAADGDDPDAFAALFTPDGVLEIAGSALVAGSHNGRAAIRERMGAGRDTRKGPGFRHHVSSVRVDADAGRSAAYFTAMTRDGADHWGRYEDRLERGPDGWAFAHRRVTIDGAAATSRLQPVD
jgi:uncharacterized protein (TIGR02246 family)